MVNDSTVLKNELNIDSYKVPTPELLQSRKKRDYSVPTFPRINESKDITSKDSIVNE